MNSRKYSKLAKIIYNKRGTYASFSLLQTLCHCPFTVQYNVTHLKIVGNIED